MVPSRKSGSPTIEGCPAEIPEDSTPVRVRIALGVLHDPGNANRLLETIRPSLDGWRNLAVIASQPHFVKYSACFEPAANAAYGPPPVLIYQRDGGLEPKWWNLDDAESARFQNRLKTFETWMAPTLISRLQSHLEQSGLIVAIALDSIRQEQDVCRMLLQCGVDYLYVQDVPE